MRYGDARQQRRCSTDFAQRPGRADAALWLTKEGAAEAAKVRAKMADLDVPARSASAGPGRHRPHPQVLVRANIVQRRAGPRSPRQPARSHGGQLVGGPGRPLRVGPGNQQPVPLQPLEALGEDVAAIPGDLAEQVIEPLRPAEQRLDQQYRPPVTDLASASASGDEPFCCSAMSGS